MSKYRSALTAAIFLIASAVSLTFSQLALASETVIANSTDAAEYLLSQIGMGVIEWVIFLFALIIVVAFKDGKARRKDED